jgi:ABC-type uncharacterized transport system fused permease/ATPase subunit
VNIFRSSCLMSILCV